MTPNQICQILISTVVFFLFLFLESGKREPVGGGGSGIGGVKMDAARFAAQLKRGGFLCGCLRDDEPPEITYCVVDGAGTLNLQAVTPALPMPEEEELNKKFAELVVRPFRPDK